jgi:hypothetical protein
MPGGLLGGRGACLSRLASLPCLCQGGPARCRLGGACARYASRIFCPRARALATGRWLSPGLQRKRIARACGYLRAYARARMYRGALQGGLHRGRLLPPGGGWAEQGTEGWSGSRARGCARTYV